MKFPLIGVLGGGQLGRMLALAGIPMGVRFRFLDPNPDSPMSSVAEQIVGSYDDPESLDRLANDVDVVTYEFENVPIESVQYLSSRVRVAPGIQALRVSQDRRLEKALFSQLGIPTPAWSAIDRFDPSAALATVGLPAVIKTCRFGYDGKGQATATTEAEYLEAVASLPGDLIAEQKVSFQRELSIISARNSLGEQAAYPLTENHHRKGILRKSISPAPGLTPHLTQLAAEYISTILDHLDYTGVLALEQFEVNGELMANEMAPRVHNSGHWTIEGAECSQFENHVRAVLGWPLGGIANLGVSGMLNLIGDHPPIEQLLKEPETHVHLYGKEPRPGRKLGHVTVVARDDATLFDRLERLESLIGVQQ